MKSRALLIVAIFLVTFALGQMWDATVFAQQVLFQGTTPTIGQYRFSVTALDIDENQTISVGNVIRVNGNTGAVGIDTDDTSGDCVDGTDYNTITATTHSWADGVSGSATPNNRSITANDVTADCTIIFTFVTPTGGITADSINQTLTVTVKNDTGGGAPAATIRPVNIQPIPDQTWTDAVSITAFDVSNAFSGFDIDHFVSFEQPSGFFPSPDTACCEWNSECTTRNNLPDAIYRVFSTQTADCEIATAPASGFIGTKAVRITPKNLNRDTASMPGGTGSGVTAQRLSGGVDTDEGFWYSWTHHNTEATKSPAAWEIYAQWHNSSAPQSGWGNTNNPAIALEREDDDFFVLLFRNNEPSGVKNKFKIGIDSPYATGNNALIPVHVNKWVRFVMYVTTDNDDDGGPFGAGTGEGIIKLWMAVENGPLVQYADVTSARVGFRRANSQGHERQLCLLYSNITTNETRIIFCDGILAIHDAPPITLSHEDVDIRNFELDDATENTDNSYSATGLPTGLSINSGSGIITGTPSGAGSGTASISSSNGIGAGFESVDLIWTVDP